MSGVPPGQPALGLGELEDIEIDEKVNIFCSLEHHECPVLLVSLFLMYFFDYHSFNWRL